ncbi:MAG: rhomboid family intramembrane serine protease [Planctomycetota bacterium]
MGIYDRDYGQSGGFGGGGFGAGGGGMGGGGFGGFDPNSARTANTNLLLGLAAVYVAQLVFSPTLGDLLSLPSDWLSRPWRAYGLVSYALLHAEDNIMHLLFNGLALFFFGRAIEPRLGGREYLTFFFCAAAFAGLVWTVSELATGGANRVLLTPAGPVPAPASQLVGASGGIAAILILFALWYPNVQVYLMGILPIPAWLMAVLFLGGDMYNAVFRPMAGNVAYTAHLGGALFGYLYFRNQWRLSGSLDGLLGGDWKLPSLASKPKLRVIKDDDDTPADPDDEKLDAVLAKIQSQGQDSLTASERRILERASKRYKQRRSD